MLFNDLAHRQPPISGETTQTEPTPAPEGDCGCSVQRSCSALDSPQDVGSEGLGRVEALIKSYASKTKHGESLLRLLRKGKKTTLEVVTSIAIELWRREFLREFISPPISSSNPQSPI